MPSWLILLGAVLYGACIGSFLNVCIFRLPRRCLRLWRPKMSFCPSCRRQLSWHDNIPILAYLFLGGRCRTCRARISPRYFFVEVGTAAFFYYLANRWLVGPGALHDNWSIALVQAVLGCALLVCALVDLDYRIIPDEINVPGFLLAPVVVFLVPRLLVDQGLDLVAAARILRTALSPALGWWGLSPGAVVVLTQPIVWFEALGTGSPAWEEGFRATGAALLGIALGGGIIFGMGWIGDRLLASPEGAMGFGDVKFLAMIGGFTGAMGVLYTLGIAAGTGALWGMSSKVLTGRNHATGKDLAASFGLGYLLLRAFGAPREAPEDDTPLKLRMGGAFAARLATGSPYLAFGPFLALGGILCVLFPEAVAREYEHFGLAVGRLAARLLFFRPR